MKVLNSPQVVNNTRKAGSAEGWREGEWNVFIKLRLKKSSFYSLHIFLYIVCILL